MKSDCTEIARLLARYLDRELDPALEKRVAEHLRACPACRERWAQLRRADALTREAAPTADDEADFARTRAAFAARFDLPAAERLRRAEQAGGGERPEEVRSLTPEQVARAALEPELAKESTDRDAVGRVPRPTWRARLRAWFAPQPAWRWASVAAGAGAVVIVTLLVLVREPDLPEQALERALPPAVPSETDGLAHEPAATDVAKQEVVAGEPAEAPAGAPVPHADEAPLVGGRNLPVEDVRATDRGAGAAAEKATVAEGTILEEEALPEAEPESALEEDAPDESEPMVLDQLVLTAPAASERGGAAEPSDPWPALESYLETSEVEISEQVEAQTAAKTYRGRREALSFRELRAGPETGAGSSTRSPAMLEEVERRLTAARDAPADRMGWARDAARGEAAREAGSVATPEAAEELGAVPGPRLWLALGDAWFAFHESAAAAGADQAAASHAAHAREAYQRALALHGQCTAAPPADATPEEAAHPPEESTLTLEEVARTELRLSQLVRESSPTSP